MQMVDIKIDPLNGYTGVKEEKLLAATGLLPQFGMMVAMQQPETAQQAFDMLMETYGFGMGQDGTGWGTVDKKGMYVSQYEEDPDMAPLVVMDLGNGITMSVYQYAITAVKDAENTLIARLD